MDGLIVHRRIRVIGTVQGVGFRPFVYRVARELGIVGFVGNDAVGVFIHAQGSEAALSELLRMLREEPPPLSRVQGVMIEVELPLDPTLNAFTIAASTEGNARTTTSLPPDTAMCENCRHEVLDPNNRRYRHPFATCTDCGPRFTIATALPYDRPNTTMAEFPMCPDCYSEYHDPADRRFHAQPIACNACGPELSFVRGVERTTCEQALAGALNALHSGETVAVKGLGGYHLACKADDADAVARLRHRKHRGDKPFAVLARDLDVVKALAHVSDDEARLLTAPESPIVLLRPQSTQRAQQIAATVAPGNGRIGIMLPPTPLHTLLLSNHPDVDEPALDAIVLTSCNLSDEPICIDDERLLADFTELADAFLMHNRRIYLPCDDSVVRVTDAQDGALPQHIRRSRGYAPTPITIPHTVTPTLAVGGEIKTALCAATGDQAWMSQHIGDTGDYATLAMLDRVAEILLQIQRIRPERIVADRHPGYLSRRWASETATRLGIEFVDVQHHHAHVASLLAEHGLRDDTQVLGFAFDGTGFGDDGSIWGGELLLGSYGHVDRVGSLSPVLLPGGDAAVKRPARIALAHLQAAGVVWDPRLPPVAACAGTEASIVQKLLTSGTSCVPTTSAGRLFDAVAAIAGVAQDAEYEGQAAIELEALAADSPDVEADPLYVVDVREGERLLLDPSGAVAAVARDAIAGVHAGTIGARFHRAMATAVADAAERIREMHGVEIVGLTGGVFQNALLTQMCSEQLSEKGFTVLVHRRVPANDGGLSLGQVLVAERSQIHTN